ncbi:MAG: TonB-dependent receptor, partial [Cyclobacteriaceae bacterium]|nr:TonB-dependent receptor [Cyclobacteriaceae bacterium]
NDQFRFNADTSYNYQNKNLTVQWKHVFSNNLYAVISGIYSGYNYNISSYQNETNAFTLDYSIDNYGLKLDFSWYPFPNHKIDFGLNSLAYRLNPGRFQPSGELSLITPELLENEQGIESAIYIGDKFDISNKLSIYAGLRYSFYSFLGPKSVNEYAPGEPIEDETKTGETSYDKNESIINYQGLEPRFSARYSLNDFNSIKISYNRMRQYIQMLSNTTSISPTDIWKLSDRFIKPQIGDQFTLGYYRNFRNNTIETSVEAYYKNINNLLDFKSGAELLMNEHIETDIVNGLGKSYGVEVLFKKKTGKLNGWVSYAYSRALIKVDSGYEEEIINNGEFYPANYDKPHAVNVLSNYRFSRRLSISGNIVYSTGRPITIPLAKYSYYGSERLHYSERNEFRIPDYFRLDISLNIEGNHKVKKLNHSSWTIGVYNLTGRNNPYSVYFVSSNGEINGYKLSIFAEPIPTVTYNFRF